MLSNVQNFRVAVGTRFANWMTSGTKAKLMNQLWCSSAEQVSDFFQELRDYGGTLSSNEKMGLLAACETPHGDAWMAAMAQGLHQEGTSVFEPITDGVSLFDQAQKIYKQDKNDQLLRALLDIAKREGHVAKYADGSVYLGLLNEQKGRQGVGVWQLKTGEIFVGEFESDGLNGYGIWRHQNNIDSYHGEFKNGKFFGKGMQVFPYSEYVGYFQDNQPHGMGIKTHSKTQERCEGQWVAGKQEGQGERTSPDGQIFYKGVFVNGMFNGLGTIAHSACTYEGEFKNNKKHGQGTWTSHMSKERYVGAWVQDKKNGEGVWTNSDATVVHKGAFANDTFHGKGVVTIQNQTEAQVEQYAGTFKNGKRDGQFVLTKGKDNFDVTYVDDVQQEQPVLIKNVSTDKCVPGCTVS